ncbi:MAG: hypothetical protein LKK21_09330 [Prevotella sp.]|jgi:O-antigen/teichoic acid export membrane protein|nr:hypothetical protein [Prevotella sp.]MCI2088598.1 hypothetical protein [Prevotella sp.]MCI2125831.1 hypothetical protein [Prevotella sp.]
MSDTKRIAKNTAFLYIRQVLVMLVSIYTSRVILQVLGASDYGVYNVVGGIVTMLSFLNGALSSSSSRFLTYELGKGNLEKMKKTFAASLNLHICVALLVLLLGETIGLWFFYNYLNIPQDRLHAAFWVYQFSIITTMMNFTQVPYNASLIAHENMSIYAYVGLYDAFSKLAIVYLLLISPIDKLIFYALLLMLNSVGIQLFYRFYTSKKYLECRFNIVKDRTLYKTLLGYSGWDLFGGVAVVCQGQGINILLNMFFGPVVNAARAIAVQVQNAIASFVNNFLTAVRPQVVKIYAQGNTDEMYRLTFSAAKFSYLLMLAFALPICFEIDTILNLWLGKSYPKDTNIFVIIILCTYLMETFHSSSLMAFHAIGKIKLGNIVGGTLMILALPLSYIALKLGAPAYSVFLVIFFVNFTQMFWGWIVVHRYVKFSYLKLIHLVYFPTIIITLITMVVPLVYRILMSEGILRFISSSITIELVLMICVYYIAMNKEEREKAVSIIKNKLKR